MKRSSLFLSVGLLLCLFLQESFGQLTEISRSPDLVFLEASFELGHDIVIPPAPGPEPGSPPASLPGCVAPVAGMVGWWPGEGNSGELVSGSPGETEGYRFVSGKVGQAFAFYNCYPAVEAPASPSIDVGAGAGLTLEMWYRPSAARNLSLAGWTDRWGNLDVVLGQAVGDSFGVPFPYPFLYANLQDTNGYNHYISAPVILDTNRFQHVAVTYDKASGMANLYLDGSLVAQSHVGSFTVQTSGNFYVGGSTDRASSFLLDEVSLYNRALAEAEIGAIFNADAAGKCRSGVPPVLLQQPRSVIALSGNPASFAALAAGSPPLTYQWQHNGQSIAGATAASLSLTNLAAAQAGSYAVEVSNAGGSVLSSNGLLTVIDLAGDEFQISDLMMSAYRTVGSAPLSGRKHNGMAAGPAQVFISDEAATAGFDLESLASQAVAGPRRSALASNLRTEQIYSLGDGTNCLAAGGGTVTTLIELDGERLQPTGRLIGLTQAIVLTNGAGIFSGVNRLVLHDGASVYDIALPSGAVRALGPMPMPPHACSGWAYWGWPSFSMGRCI